MACERNKVLIFFGVYHLSAILSLLHTTISTGPPRLLPTSYDLKKVVAEGTTAVLPCTVQADDLDSLFFEWVKEREPVDSFGDRTRVTNSGSLKIKNSVTSDTGYYTCKAVNGFGSVLINVTLIVYGPGVNPDDITLPPRVQTTAAPIPSLDFYDDYSEEDPSLPYEKPKIVHSTKQALGQEFIQRAVGSNLKLKCVGEGNPRPRISWLKNGQELTQPNKLVGGSPEAQPETEPKKGRWSFTINSLQPLDSGNYTCLLRNRIGSTAMTFVLDVLDRGMPEISGGHPINTTVYPGDTANFQCRIKSHVPPHIQWLKRIDGTPEPDEETVEVQGDLWMVLKSSSVTERADGTYINRLSIPEVKMSDSGKYICMGTNTLGNTIRSAFLVVTPKHKQPVEPVDWGQNLFNGTGKSSTIIIAVPIILGMAIGVLIALVIHCHRRKVVVRQEPINPNSNTSRSMSPPTTEYVAQVPIQAQPQFKPRTVNGYAPADIYHKEMCNQELSAAYRDHRDRTNSADTKTTWASRGQNTWSSGSSSMFTDGIHYHNGSEHGSYLLLRSNSPMTPSMCSEAVIQGSNVVSRLYAPNMGQHQIV